MKYKDPSWYVILGLLLLAVGVFIGAMFILIILGFFLWVMFSMGEHSGRSKMQKEAIKLGLGEWVMVIENEVPSTKFQWVINKINPSTVETMEAVKP